MYKYINKIKITLLSLILLMTQFGGINAKNEIVNDNTLSMVEPIAGSDNKTMANVVVFAYFEDAKQEEVDHFHTAATQEHLKTVYDGNNPTSFKGYIDEISYGKLNVVNVFPQETVDGIIQAIEVPYTKAETYKESMSQQIADYIAKNIPETDQVLDYNTDGVIDSFNIVFIDEASNYSDYPTIWPHYNPNKDSDTTYNGLTLKQLHVENTDAIYGGKDGSAIVGGAGIISHEFLHLLGYPDLYTAGDAREEEPVGGFDIMALSTQFLQWPLAYMRQEYSGWANLEIITESATNLTLSLQSNSDGKHGYIIKSPYNEYEFFVVEYRNGVEDTTMLDSKLGGSGLIVYRINTLVTNLSNLVGEYGVYIYRDINPSYEGRFSTIDAFYSGNHPDETRRSLGSSNLEAAKEDGTIFYSDGSNSGVVIDNISNSGGDTMTFNVTIPSYESVDLWENTNLVAEYTGNSKDIEIIDYNNILYAVTADSNDNNATISLYNYISDSWVKISSFNTLDLELFEGIKVFVYNNEIHVAYLERDDDWLTTINIKKYTSSATWEDVYVSPNKGTSIYDVIPTDVGIKVLETQENGGGLVDIYVKNINTSETVNVSSKISAGSSKLVYDGINTYVAYSMGSNIQLKVLNNTAVIGEYLYTADTGTLNTTFDIASHENNIYLLTNEVKSADDKLILNTFKEGGWEKIAEKTSNYVTPQITSSQGNIYVLAPSNNDGGSTYVYRYTDDDTIAIENRFVVEGERVSASTESQSIVSIGNSLYVGYFAATNKFEVKEKVSSNQLIGISLNALPTKIEYNKGDATDSTGLTINAIYEQDVRVVTDGFTISDFDTTTAGERTAIVTYEGKTTTFNYLVNSAIKTVESIEIKSPGKTSYYIDEILDLSSLEIIINYTDGSTNNVLGTDINVAVTGFDSSTPEANQELTVSYDGFTTTYTINIEDVVINKITVSVAPEKLTYFVGDEIVETGLKVTATYNNSTERELARSEFTISNYNTETVGESIVANVIYNDTISTTFNYNVKAIELTKLTVEDGYKTDYFIGDALVKTNLVVKAHYNNGDVEVLSSLDFSIDGFDSSEAITNQKLTITYEGVSTNIYVNINEVLLKTLIISVLPNKLTYVQNAIEEIDLTGLVVFGDYNNGDKDIVIDNEDLTITGFNNSAIGVNTIIISIGSVKAQFNLEIIEKEVTDFEILSQPHKTNYYLNDSVEFDKTGLQIKVYYNNGNADIIDNTLVDIANFNTSELGQKNIDVVINGITKTLTINIIERYIVPTVVPTVVPTSTPTSAPTSAPTSVPTVVPTSVPTVVPTSVPTVVPTSVPTVVPTIEPTTTPDSIINAEVEKMVNNTLLMIEELGLDNIVNDSDIIAKLKELITNEEDTEKAQVLINEYLKDIEYKILEETSLNIVLGSDENNIPSIRTALPFEHFKAVYINNELLDSKHYLAKEGSTIIEFKEEYIDTLTEGVYEVKIDSEVGYSTTVLTITEEQLEKSNLLFTIFSIIAAIIIGFGIYIFKGKIKDK